MSDKKRVALGERVVEASPTPTPGPLALEASEVAPVGLVPRRERQRPRRVSRALASVPESGKLRPQVPSAELIADARAAKRILDGEEDPDWGSSSSVSSYDLPKLDSEDEAEYVLADPVPNTESLQSASVQTADWEKPDTPRSAGASASQSFGFVSGQPRQGLAAPPLYAATVPPGRTLSECFQVAEGQLDQIQGVLSRKDTRVVVDERSQQEKDGDARAAVERPPAASSSSDSGTRTTKRRAPTNAAREGSPSRRVVRRSSTPGRVESRTGQSTRRAHSDPASGQRRRRRRRRHIGQRVAPPAT